MHPRSQVEADLDALQNLYHSGGKTVPTDQNRILGDLIVRLLLDMRALLAQIAAP